MKSWVNFCNRWKAINVGKDITLIVKNLNIELSYHILWATLVKAFRVPMQIVVGNTPDIEVHNYLTGKRPHSISNVDV